MPSLRLSHIRKVYPAGCFVALQGLSLELGHGVFGLLGPNGAGKSTLMGILAGSLEFESGQALLDEVDLARHPLEWRRRLGYLPQMFDFPPHLTGREFLSLCAYSSGLSPRKLRGRIDDLLARVNLSQAASRAAASYSRGMKQRLGVAAALLPDPALVLLDEPTSGLDPQERVFFRELLASLSSDRIIVLSTHIVADVERCCDRVGILVGGQLCYDGSPGALVSGVAGQVWEMPMGEDQVDQWAKSRRLVAVRGQSDSIIARVLSKGGAPGESAKPVAAGLEDAYMSMVDLAGGNTRQAMAASEADA